MIGFNSEASTANDHYNTLNFAFYCHPGTTMYIYESGTHVYTDSNGWSDEDWHEIRFEGGKVQYFMRYFDSFFAEINLSLVHENFLSFNLPMFYQ